MLKNKFLEERRKKISQETKNEINYSFLIVDRIDEILTKQGKTRKDLAIAMNKKESEISKWMRGTHNFTVNTIAKIEHVLGEQILSISSSIPTEPFINKKNIEVKVPSQKQEYSTFIENKYRYRNTFALNKKDTYSNRYN